MSSSHVLLAAKGGGMVFGGRLFVWGMRFVLAVFLARLLGADSYGLYNIALSVATLGAALSVLGFDSALVRYLAVFMRRSDRAGVLGTLRTGLGVPMLISLIPAALLLSAAEPLARNVIGDSRLEPLLRVVAFLIPAMVANSLLGAALQGAQRIGWAVLAEQFAQPLVRFALLVALALVGLTAELAVIASTVATIIVSALLLAFMQRQVSFDGVTRAGNGQLRVLLGFSLPVYFSNVVTTFGGSLQTLLLGAMASVASAGIFAVAHQVMLIGTVFHSAIVQSSMPIFAELQDAEDRRPVTHLYRTTSKWTLTLNLPFFLIALMFPQALLGLFGPEFADGATALAVLALASVMNAVTGTSGAVLDMTGHTRVKLVNSTLSVGLGILLNLLLIPPLGVMGAALSVVGSVSLVNLLRVGQVRWLVGVGPYDRTWLKPILAGAGAALVGWLVSSLLADIGLAARSVAGIAALGLTYAGLLVALGLNADDRLVLSRVGRRIGRRRRAERGGATIEAAEAAASEAAHSRVR
jgi:O-antigen/teichoic acid export membrane protein